MAITRISNKTSSKIEGKKMPTSVIAAPASAPAMAPAMTVETAKAMIARVDAAEAAGVEMTDENMRDLGYVEDEGGVWELPIPVHILRQL